MPVSLKKSFRKGSSRSGKAKSSAKTGAAITSPPVSSAASNADCASELRDSSLFHKAKDVSVERGCHEPRISRMCLSTAFLPAETPRVPMPLYFANGLFARTGRTRNPVRSFSKSNLSPGRTPRARRISCGTVICPLLVIRACFFIVSAPLHSLLYHIAPYSVLKLQLVCN
jgi:hypothetical protein